MSWPAIGLERFRFGHEHCDPGAVCFRSRMYGQIRRGGTHIVDCRRLDKAKGRNPTFVFLLIRPLFLLRAAGFISCAMLRIERVSCGRRLLDCAAEAAYPTYRSAGLLCYHLNRNRSGWRISGEPVLPTISSRRTLRRRTHWKHRPRRQFRQEQLACQDRACPARS